MDATAQEYVSKLKAARSDEAARSEQRRSLRSSHLVDRMREQQADVRSALRLRVHQRISNSQSAIMEQALLDTVRRTARWWNAICDHAVEQRLNKERAEQNRCSNRTEYLRSVRTREHQEQRSVQETDTERWTMAREAFLRREVERQKAAIEGTARALLANVDACVDFLDTFAMENSKCSILAQFGMSDVIEGSYLPRTARDAPSDRCAAREAFRTFFKEVDPLHLSTPYLPPLLRALLRKVQLEGYGVRDVDGDAAAPAARSSGRRASARLIFDVSRVPVFAVAGAKFSGKTLLTRFLVEEFDFVCFTDRDLVSKAMAAHASAQGSTAATPDAAADNEADPHDDATSLAAAWAAAGAEVTAVLHSGGAVDAALLARLVALLLEEVQADTAVKGVVLDGILNTAEAFRRAQEAILPAADAPLRAVVDRWSGARPAVDAADDLSGGATAAVVSAWLPPAPPAAEEQQPKKDPKARATKKAVDMTSLPPPTLPTVDDVSVEVRRERQFIEKASRELATSHGGIISAFFYMDCPPQTIFERYAGLRVDRETREEYHMTYHPPPEERLAALVSADRTEVHTAQLADLVFHQQQGWRALERWLRANPAASASHVVPLDGSAGRAVLEAEAAAAVRQALASFTAGLQLREAVHAAQERIQQLEGRRRAQEAAWAAERQRLVALYTEKGVPQLPAELLAPHPPGAQAEESAAEPEEATPEEAAALLMEAIPGGMAEVFFPVLAALTTTYEAAYRAARDSTAAGVRALLRYRVAAREHVRRYWDGTPDAKQSLLDGFVRRLNATPSSLRSRHACKDELHGLVDDLRAGLFACISSRKRECAALVDAATRRDAFLDSWVANVSSVGALLVQAEASRFSTLAGLVVFYFSALTGEPVPADETDVLDVPGAAPIGPGSSDGTGSGDGPRASTAAAVGPSAPGAVAGKRGAGGGGGGAAGKKATPHGGSAASPGASGGGGGGGGGGAAGGSGAGGRAAEDAAGGDRAAQEAFVETVQRIVGVAHGLVDRLRAGGTKAGVGKTEKKGAATPSMLLPHPFVANPVKYGALIGKCLPIIESELAMLEERVGLVRDFVVELMHQGEAYRQKLRGELRADATEVLKTEAAATNTAIYVVRCCIEEEQPSPRMHLGCGTFAVLDETDTEAEPAPLPPSFLTDVPLYQELTVPAVCVHATLTAARLLQLIDAFSGLAPDYRLGRDDFMLTVTEADYAGAVATARPGRARAASASSMLSATTLVAQKAMEGASMEALKSTADVFRAFDVQEAGFIDWREFVMHLLLWCAPPPARPLPMTKNCSVCSPAHPSGGAANVSAPAAAAAEPAGLYMPELSIEQLVGARRGMGLDPLPESAFREVSLFPDAPLGEEHREVYMEALRRTFRDPSTGLVDVYALLYFHCTDVQPIRGVQKAFYALSSLAEEKSGVTRDEMERIFHTHAANPRALGRYDPFSKLNSRLLYSAGVDGAQEPKEIALLTFPDICGCLMGRKMLNSLGVFQRKRFVHADRS